MLFLKYALNSPYLKEPLVAQLTVDSAFTGFSKHIFMHNLLLLFFFTYTVQLCISNHNM